MSKTVKINDCNFEKKKLKIKQGKIIFFTSNDMRYVLDLSNRNIVDPQVNVFPLTINKGETRNIKIKDSAPIEDYTLEITKGCSNVKAKKDTPRPTMIIKVE